MSNTRQILLLIGPKGSGKTFIGQLLQHHYQINFLRVEDWVKEFRRKPDLSSDDYLRQVFGLIEEGVRKALGENRIITFESTGLTDHFDAMIASLKKDFLVTTIGVQTDPDLCVQRVKTRDASMHLPFSESQIKAINKAATQKNMATDFQLDNSNRTVEELKLDIDQILKKLDLHEPT